ncbi:CaLponIn-liKe proteins [Caenorhabditis elegans]|uniref:CaLponIn-liKe proteins n=3 Tax=Caenorhabditis TaxID=6237 RepID=Q2MGE5_CAEEL|nr:CaLponIn-liKe proteins [Caenorhabditis elegans]CCD70002.1 CaLponIn-liKe proteins [Caenorhabditis elegans]|eukprot:NP_001040674.1 CaLponIn-liKe proteins [Caenorhabditis elegans]
MTGFGTPRDVKGKHLKRIWELEFPEEAADFQQQPVNAQPQN